MQGYIHNSEQKARVSFTGTDEIFSYYNCRVLRIAVTGNPGWNAKERVSPLPLPEIFPSPFPRFSLVFIHFAPYTMSVREYLQLKYRMFRFFENNELFRHYHKN